MDRGFTLIELLITLAISGIIMTGVYTAFKSQQDSYLAQEQVAEMQQNIRAGLDIITRELRMAGYDPDDFGQAGFTTATANVFAFSSVADSDGVDNDNADGDNNPSTGADEPGELETLQYDLYDAYSDGDNDLGRSANGASRQAVAENIENIEFYYTLNDGPQTTTPAQLNEIRAVQVSILARAANSDRNYTNSNTYTTASGAVLGPFNDNFRRRFQITTVNLRNMGL